MERALRPIIRSRTPVHRRLLADPAALRWWGGAVAAAILAASLVTDAVDRAADARERWGDTVAVVVTTRDVDAGAPLGPVTRTVRWPVALAPARRLDALPHGAVAGRALPAGMAVVPADLRRRAGPGDRPTIAIALADVHVAVEAGDRVDLWAAGGDALLAADAQPARRVASGAIITVADEGSITVAIRPAEVAAVASAVAGTTVVPVAVG